MLFRRIDVGMSENVSYQINIPRFPVEIGSVSASQFVRGDFFQRSYDPGILFYQLFHTADRHIGYNEAKRWSKHPEEFGHGAPEGIAAPESANNAVSGGAMIPLLTLGIPGDSVTAIMLGALMMQGITPGPLLFSTQTVDVYSIIISLFVCNIFMCLLGYGAIRIFSKISLVPMKWLNPIVFVFCVVGTYAINNNIYDVFLMIGAGIVGYFLIKLDFCMPPIILGLILGGTVEENLRRTLVLSDGSFSIFLSHPIALVLLAIAAISLLSPIFLNLWKKRSTNKQAGN